MGIDRNRKDLFQNAFAFAVARNGLLVIKPFSKFQLFSLLHVCSLRWPLLWLYICFISSRLPVSGVTVLYFFLEIWYTAFLSSCNPDNKKPITLCALDHLLFLLLLVFFLAKKTFLIRKALHLLVLIHSGN